MEQQQIIGENDTIAAVSTPYGMGGIAVVRVSGLRAIEAVAAAWKGRPLVDAASHTAHLGRYLSTDGELIDEAVATVFRAPASFTGEDVVEISVHGSRWIQREIIADLSRRGVRVANPGEFTQRAFLNGKLDLAQAEGVADLIASSSKAAHSMALSQTKGLFSKEFDMLRDKLVEFASLLELELDFSEEDVEFANRENLLNLANSIMARLKRLAASYSAGSVIKEGVPVVIAGIPNAGKSSVLNLLLSDDKAIVSDIPGTTRDSIEDTIELNGILYRFIDTAGLRSTSDKIEGLGIDRARHKMRQASIVIWVLDPTVDEGLQLTELDAFRKECPDKRIVALVNKSDLLTPQANDRQSHPIQVESSKSIAVGAEPFKSIATGADPFKCPIIETVQFSATTGQGLDQLIDLLQGYALGGYNPESDVIVTNARHYSAILRGVETLTRAIDGITAGVSADFIAQDIRETIHHLSAITGSITTTTLLHSIFSRFCIGK